MPRTITVDLNAIYAAWRIYLIAHSKAEHFGMVYDSTQQAKFPYANLMMINRPTNGSDLGGDEASITLTFETEAYINSNKYLTLYEIDTASANFFSELGFRRIGDTQLLKVSGTVTKVVSRFVMTHYCGSFLKELGEL